MRLLDEEGFQRFLKRGGRSQRVVSAAVARVEEFECYLKEKRGGKELDAANPKDLEAFIAWVEKEEAMAAKKYLLGIRYYYEYVSNETMSNFVF